MKEFWNARYQNINYFYGEAPNVFLEKSAGLIPANSKILCLAEGEGRNAVFLAKLGHQVTAVDLSSEGKKKALNLAKKNGVEIDYVESALEKYDFGKNKWDCIVSIFCHLPPEVRKIVHSNAFDSLKSGGIFFLVSYNPAQLKLGTGGPKDVQMLYTPQLLNDDFPALRWEKMSDLVCTLNEGEGHNGESSILTALGVKG